MKKTYDVEVDCANCAAKMEEAVKNTEGVKNATLSFMTLKLKVEFEEGALEPCPQQTVNIARPPRTVQVVECHKPVHRVAGKASAGEV